MEIKVSMLGTSNSFPTRERNHPAMLLEWNGENILIDCGEGTQRQFRKAGLNPCRITKILITHLHGDHSLGLPGLLETLSMSEYSKILDIYGPRGIDKHIYLLQQVYGKFGLRYEVHEMPCKIEDKEFIIEHAAMSHGVPTYAYAFIVKDKVRLDKKKLAKFKVPNSPLLGELQKGKDIVFNGKKIRAKQVTYKQEGKKIAFILDTKMNDSAIEIARNADLLICESTYASEEASYAEDYNHLTAAQAATIAKKAGVGKLVLTHISQRYEHQLKKLESEARKIFKNTVIAKDLDVFSV